MLHEVAIRLGIRESDVEDSMTMDQIKLRFHWAQRAELRRARLDEHTLKKAIAWAFNGSKDGG